MFIHRKTHIVKTSVLPSSVYRFNAILIIIPSSYFVDISILILKFIRRSNRPLIANIILKEKKKLEADNI